MKSLKDMSRAEYEARLRKLRNRITVTFESAQDRAAIAPSLCGQTYLRGEILSGLTKNQVAYRQSVARRLFSLPRGMGFARQWRNGTSEIPLVRKMQQEMLTAISAMLTRELPKRRIHPTPETTTIDEA